MGIVVMISYLAVLMTIFSQLVTEMMNSMVAMEMMYCRVVQDQITLIVGVDLI